MRSVKAVWVDYWKNIWLSALVSKYAGDAGSSEAKELVSVSSGSISVEQVVVLTSIMAVQVQ